VNIFYLHTDPYLAAMYQCDKHVVKMVLETAQLLCSVHHILGSNLPEDKLYRLTHKNHPCAIWARSSRYNYDWLRRHGMGLCKEYTLRYGKVHKSQQLIELCNIHMPNLDWNIPHTPPPQAMPEECKIELNTLPFYNTTRAYRKYYNNVKRLTMDCSWNKTRSCPSWFIREDTYAKR
jgi:hypothetical protein